MPDSDSASRFTELIAAHARQLHKVALTYGITADDRDDLYQEIVAELWRSFRSYDETRTFATWMYRVALNVAISHVRRITRDRGRLAVGHSIDLPDPRAIEREADERAAILRELLAELDELDRALLLLHLEDRSYAEIADVLGISASNVGTRLTRLRERLRRLVNERIQR